VGGPGFQDQTEEASLLRLNKSSRLDLLAHFQNPERLSPAQADQLLAVDEAFCLAFASLRSRLNEIADVTGGTLDAAERLTRALCLVRD
jgi:hypothetical protein